MDWRVFKSSISFLILGMIPFVTMAERSVSFTGTDLYGWHIRALTMGNAFTAVAKTGETALLYNPAGLATTYSDDFNIAFAANADLSYATATRELAEDLEKTEGSSDSEAIDAFVSKYEDDTQVFDAQFSGYLAYQQEKPFRALRGLNRIGAGIQRNVRLLTQLQFPRLGSKTINFNQTAAQVADDVTAILLSDYDIVLDANEKQDLTESIQELKDDEGVNLAEQESIINRMVQRGIDAQIFLLEMTNAGLAGSTLDQLLKTGLSIKSYNLTALQLNNYPIAQAVSEDFKIEEAAPEQSATATGFDIGALYSFEKFFLSDWHPQIGVVWQNIGGVDFGKDANVELVDSLNIGVSVTKEIDFALLIVAADITDITGNYYRLDEDGKQNRRSFIQRFHFGTEVGLWEAAAMENRYLYLRSGFNQGQFTFGVEASLPWNILRIGYGRYGLDLGDESESDILTKEIIYLSLGGVI